MRETFSRLLPTVAGKGVDSEKFGEETPTFVSSTLPHQNRGMEPLCTGIVLRWTAFRHLVTNFTPKGPLPCFFASNPAPFDSVGNQTPDHMRFSPLTPRARPARFWDSGRMGYLRSLPIEDRRQDLVERKRHRSCGFLLQVPRPPRGKLEAAIAQVLFAVGVDVALDFGPSHFKEPPQLPRSRPGNSQTQEILSAASSRTVSLDSRTEVRLRHGLIGVRECIPKKKNKI